MVSPTQWTWVWVDFGSWWWTGRPGVLQFMGSQGVGHDWAIERNWTETNIIVWSKPHSLWRRKMDTNLSDCPGSYSHLITSEVKNHNSHSISCLIFKTSYLIFKTILWIGLTWWLRWWRICPQCKKPGFNLWVGKIPRRMKWLPTPVFLPGEFHGQRSLVGYSPWGHRVRHDWTTNTFILWIIEIIHRCIEMMGKNCIEEITEMQFCSAKNSKHECMSLSNSWLCI